MPNTDERTPLYRYNNYELEQELHKRELNRRKLQRQIWEGEIQPTDGDNTQTMANYDSYWKE